MDSILQSIKDWFRELLVSGIMSNLTNIFDSVNAQVGQIATEVGQTPANFSLAVYNMIRTLSENVIMPIAGLILTFIACYELIQLVIDITIWQTLKLGSSGSGSSKPLPSAISTQNREAGRRSADENLIPRIQCRWRAQDTCVLL